MTDQGSTYADYVAEVLRQEQVRRSALDSRGLSVLTTSGALVALVVALGSWVTGKDYKVTSTAAIVIVAAAAIAFLASAVLGLLANRLRAYKVASSESLDSLLGERWRDSEVTARSTVAQLNVRSVLSLRSGNNSKATQLEVALWTQLAGLALLTCGVAFEFFGSR